MSKIVEAIAAIVGGQSRNHFGKFITRTTLIDMGFFVGLSYPPSDVGGNAGRMQSRG